MNAEVFLIHYSTFIRIIHRRDLHRHGLRHRDPRDHDRLRRCDPHHHHDHCHRQSRYFPPLVHARGHCYLPVLELAPDPDQAEDRVQEVLAQAPVQGKAKDQAEGWVAGQDQLVLAPDQAVGLVQEVLDQVPDRGWGMDQAQEADLAVGQDQVALDQVPDRGKGMDQAQEPDLAAGQDQAA